MPLNSRNISIRLFISILLWLFLLTGLSSQNYIIRSFNTENGLPHNNIRTIVRDSTGFIWAASWDGLSRFDGYQFKNYFHTPGDSNSIPYFSVQNLVVDGANNLFIYTDNSEISMYDRKNDNFTVFPYFRSRFPDRVINMNIDKKGDLWIMRTNDLIKREAETGSLRYFKIIDENNEPLSLGFSSQFDINFVSDTEIWIIGEVLFELDVVDDGKNDTGTVRVRKKYSLDSSYRKKIFDFELFLSYSIYKSPAENYWLFSTTGLFLLDKGKGVFREYRGPIDKNEFTGRRYFDWAWIDGGIFSWDSKTKVLRHIETEKTRMVKTILHPGRDIIWISNTSHTGTPLGMSSIIFTGSLFTNYIINGGSGELPAVYSIIKDQDNNIWAGVRGLDYILSISPDNKRKEIGKISPEMMFRGGHIRSLAAAKEGIWIGYFKNLLRFYDYKKGTFVTHEASEYSYRTVIPDKEGNLIIGTSNLTLYNPLTGKKELLYKSAGTEIFYNLLLTDEGILWAGMSTNALIRYNTLTRETSSFSVSSEMYHIEDILTEKNGSLWLATLGGGVVNFFPETGEKKYYTTSTGLSNNTTYSLLRDKSGNIWVSTDNGISRINSETGNIRIFNESDGLSIKEFNSDAVYEDDKGRFFFGGMGGFISFHPDSIGDAEKGISRQGVLITEFRVSGAKKILSKPVNESDTIILDRGENNFSFRFGTKDFISWDKTIYRYKLDKINKDWVETDHQNRSVNYSNLRPGWYDLHLQTTNRSGEWAVSKDLVIHIMPYFYQTKLFIGFSILFIFALSYLIISLYLRQLKQKARQELDELRLQALRGQMNPHFIFNSLNSINYFISNNDRVSANRYIANFARLIRSILSDMGNEYVPLEGEMSSIRDYLEIEHLRFGDKFQYKLDYSDIANTDLIKVFPGLIQPFVENAIWHGVRALENRKANIMVRLSRKNNDMISCTIQDDGIGRVLSGKIGNKKENHNSRGIAIVTERLQIISKIRGHGYNLRISDLNPGVDECGTRIEIDIPSKET